MHPMVPRTRPSLRAKKTIFSLACVLGLAPPVGVAWAQEGADEEAEVGESPDPPAGSETTDTPVESEGADSATSDSGAGEQEASTDEAGVEDEADAEEETDVSASESDVPTVEGAVEPREEDALDSEPSAAEPDYFGGLEPSSPAYQLEEPSLPEKPSYTGPFRAGALRFGLGIGGGGYGDQTYFILGFGVGYFLVNGLELHVDTDFWLIGEPFMATPSPGLRYVMWFVPKVHPYVGGFYRHYFSGSGYPDANSVGARGGAYLMTGQSSYFGLGVAYEHMLDENLFVDTDFIYPEIAFAFSF